MALVGRLFILNQLRDGDPDVFFSHENQLQPPSISDHGKLHACEKSHLVKCLEPTAIESEKFEDFGWFTFQNLMQLKPSSNMQKVSLLSFPEVKIAFQDMVDHPLNVFDETAEHFALLERFTVILYDRKSTCNSVNKARLELFCQKNPRRTQKHAKSRHHFTINSTAKFSTTPEFGKHC